MRILKIKLLLKPKELKRKCVNEKNTIHLRYWKLLYAISVNKGNKTARDYAMDFDLGIHNVYRIVQLYNTHGLNFIDSLKHGGRRINNSYLSTDAEIKLVCQFKRQYKTKSKKAFIKIKSVFEKTIGRGVSDAYIKKVFIKHEKTRCKLQTKKISYNIARVR